MPYDSWADAIFAQARQDFYLALLGANTPSKNDNESYGASVCMLLQMFFEKYAKAVYCVQAQQLPPKSHKTTSQLLRTLRASPKYKRWKNNLAYRICFAFMQKLERLQPANANSGKVLDDTPQLEYPWYEHGCFYAPATDLSIVSELIREKDRILRTAEELIEDFPIYIRTHQFS